MIINFLRHGRYAWHLCGEHGFIRSRFDYQYRSRFDDRLATAGSQFGKQAIVAHIDIDPVEIGKIVETKDPNRRRCQGCFAANAAVPTNKRNLDDLVGSMPKTEKGKPYRYDRTQTQEIKPQKVIEEVGRLTKRGLRHHRCWSASNVGRAVLSFSLSQTIDHQWRTRDDGLWHPCRNRRSICSSRKMVVVFVGDGGFQMTNQEFAILNEYGLNVKFVLLNNCSLGMVRQWQETFHGKRRSASVFAQQPDFVKLAQAYGIEGCRIDAPEQLADQLAAAFSQAGRS